MAELDLTDEEAQTFLDMSIGCTAARMIGYPRHAWFGLLDTLQRYCVEILGMPSNTTALVLAGFLANLHTEPNQGGPLLEMLGEKLHTILRHERERQCQPFTESSTSTPEGMGTE